MAENWFSNNFTDLSRSQGVNAGFQFEFYCERCRNAFRTDFEPYRGGQAAGWLGKASGFLGGALGGAEQTVSGMAEQSYGRLRDEKFREAIANASQHFNRCAKCFQYVCEQCWNGQRGLCFNCAPDVEVEIERARNEGELAAVSQRAREEGEDRAETRDVKRDRQLVCPSCNAETHGAKFCPECGTKLATTVTCGSCGAECAQNAKFCGECGASLGL